MLFGLLFLHRFSRFGISVSAILAGAGVVGLAVGFGAQTVVKDIITGFLLFLKDNSMSAIMFKSIHQV